MHFILSKGEASDSDIAVDLLSDIDISGSNILADKAYGTAEIREYIESQNAKYTIPPKVILLIHGIAISGFIKNVI